MRNFEQFVRNSVDILYTDIQRASKVCTHADLAVSGPGVENTPFNEDMHKRLMFCKLCLSNAMAILDGYKPVPLIPTAEQRIKELEAELAKAKAEGPVGRERDGWCDD